MAKKILFLGTIFLLLAGISNLAAFGSREDDTETETEQAEAGETTAAQQQEKTIDIQDIQTQVEKIFADSHQSVVNITSTVVTPNMFNQPVPQQGAGSGFVWDEEGHIVTNFHVVQNAESIAVSFGNDEMLEAELVGSDLFTDLAVLEVEKDSLPPPLQVGDSDDVRVGEFVVAIGNPFSFERTLTFGVVSAIGRVIRSAGGRFISEAIQTDTPINPGNSGGPLIDLNGRVIGVNSAIISPSGASAGIGFAISANTLQQVIPSLIEKGSYPHPYLGFQSVDLQRGLIKLLEEEGITIPVDEGVLVVNVLNGTPADEAGLQGGDRQLRLGNYRLPVGGDILVGIEGESVTTYKELVVYLETKTEIGDTIEVTFYRDGEKQSTKVTVGKRPENM